MPKMEVDYRSRCALDWHLIYEYKADSEDRQLTWIHLHVKFTMVISARSRGEELGVEYLTVLCVFLLFSFCCLSH